MTFARKAQSAEMKVGRVVDTLVERLVGSSPRQPLEILHALIEDVERQVQPAGRGKWVFPFNRLTAEFLAPTREARARLAGVIGNPESIRARIEEKLRPACRLGSLDIVIRYRTTRGAKWINPEYHLEFDQVAQPAAVPASVASASSSIELTITSGVADRRRFAFSKERIDIGRGPEVLDTRQRLLRRNQIAFTENAQEINQTVSRRHAHILYHDASHEYRIYDDNSARGTSIVRHGSTISVPGGSRGVRLQSGDELVLGQARLRVNIIG